MFYGGPERSPPCMVSQFSITHTRLMERLSPFSRSSGAWGVVVVAREIPKMINCPEDVCLHEKPEQLLGVSASVAAFWLASFSALADRRAPHPQSRLVLLAVSVLS